MSRGNVQIVKDCYQAFLSGDLERLYGALASDVAWEHVGRATDLPTFAPHHGVDGVREFFRLVAETLDFNAFMPREFHGAGNLVFVMGDYEVTMRKTGKRAASPFMHVFWLKNEKVTRFLEFTDTATIGEAWRG